MSRVEFLDALAAWFEREIKPLGTESVVVDFGRTTGNRPEHAAWISIDSGGRLGEIAVWDSGEVELVAGSEGQPEIAEHHEIDSVPALRRLLHRLLEIISTAPEAGSHGQPQLA